MANSLFLLMFYSEHCDLYDKIRTYKKESNLTEEVAKRNIIETCRM